MYTQVINSPYHKLMLFILLLTVISFDRYFLIDDLADAVEVRLAKLKDEHEPICRVPVITTLEEEHLIVSTSGKVMILGLDY